MNSKQQIFVNKLRSWHSNYTRTFPWRETRDPYKILVAEILLRKTTRTQVEDTYQKIIDKYPKITDLSLANSKNLERILEPMGMQKKRAPLFIKLANHIVNEFDGEIPKNAEELKKLPGIGQYTANAILCLSYNKPLPLVDTNTIRIIERVFKMKSKKARARTDQAIWLFVEKLLPIGKSRELNLAMLDFANDICKSKNPLCRDCPIKEICQYEKNEH